MATAYFENTYTLSKHDDVKYKFKEINPIDLLSIVNEFEMYVANNVDASIYKKYSTTILENTLVLINDKWLPLKEGNNYYPVYLKTDLKSLREILDKFFVDIIKPVFTDAD